MDCGAAIVTPATMAGRTAVTTEDWLPKSRPPGEAPSKSRSNVAVVVSHERKQSTS